MKNRLLMNKQLISFQNQRQPVSKTSSPTVDLGEMVLISRKKNAHNIGTFTWEIWCLKYTIVGSTPRFAYLGKFTSYMVFIYGLPWWLRWERIGLQCGRPGFNPWLGKIPWRRAWQPTPVFSPGEPPWTKEPGRLQSMGLQRAGHNWVIKHTHGIVGEDLVTLLKIGYIKVCQHFFRLTDVQTFV